MKLLIKIVLGLVALAVLLVLVGFFLPADYRVERSITIQAPAERIFANVNDLKKWRNWTAWNQRDPAMKVTYTGPETGVGAKMAWESPTEGNGEFTITESSPSKHIGYSLYFPDFNSTSKGVMTFEPDNNVIRVVWTNEGSFGGNPIMRYFGLMMDSMVGPDFELGLKNLKNLSESAG